MVKSTKVIAKNSESIIALFLRWNCERCAELKKVKMREDGEKMTTAQAVFSRVKRQVDKTLEDGDNDDEPFEDRCDESSARILEEEGDDEVYVQNCNEYLQERVLEQDFEQPSVPDERVEQSKGEGSSKCQSCYKIRTVKFQCSAKLMISSLQNLVDNLKTECKSVECSKCTPELECEQCQPLPPAMDIFPNTYAFVASQYGAEHFPICLSKSPFPYQFITSVECLSYQGIPPKSAYYNDLSKEEISDSDYALAKRLFKDLKMRTVGDILKHYQISDTVLLLDCLLFFRKLTYDQDELDISFYLSLPQLVWDAMLLHNQRAGIEEIELLSDERIFKQFQGDIRGGFANAVQRYFTSNSSYLPPRQIREARVPAASVKTRQFGPSLPPELRRDSCGLWDAANLYGFAASDDLIVGGIKEITGEEFHLVSQDLFQNMGENLADEGRVGWYIVCDVSYPPECHLRDQYFPLFPTNEKVDPSKLSEYTCDAEKRIKGSKRCSTGQKLISSLEPKKHLGTHYRALKYALQKGLKLEKVHQIYSFRQGKIFKEFVDCNTKKRNVAKSLFTRDFYKGILCCKFECTCVCLHTCTCTKLVGFFLKLV